MAGHLRAENQVSYADCAIAVGIYSYIFRSKKARRFIPLPNHLQIRRDAADSAARAKAKQRQTGMIKNGINPGGQTGTAPAYFANSVPTAAFGQRCSAISTAWSAMATLWLRRRSL